MLSVPLLFGVIGIAMFVWFWQNSLSARERANRAAMDACARMNLQFLDGTVAFTRLSVARTGKGRISLRRTYVFDYTATSIERRQGFVTMLGLHIETIGFEPDNSLSDHSRLCQPTPLDDLDHHSSNVLDLAEWRQRRRNQAKLPDARPPSSHSSNDHTPSDNGW